MMPTPSSRYDLLILGGSGFIGARAAQAAQAAGWRVAGTHRTRPLPPGIPGWQVDLCDLDALTALLRETQPRAVIHCAVNYTPETLDEDNQMRSSAYSTRTLVDALQSLSLATRIVYVSTNAVFSGFHAPNTETSLPDPEARHDPYRYYGLARRAGELLALNGWPNSIVARAANVDGFDAWGQLNRRMTAQLDQLRSGQPTDHYAATRYVDRVISPTLVDSVVSALLEIAQPEFPLPQATGRVLHLAGRESITDYAFARRIAARLGMTGLDIQEAHYLPPGATGTYNIALDVTRSQALLRTRFLTIDQMLDEILGTG